MNLSREENSNIGKKRESNPSNSIRKNKRSKVEVDRGNSDEAYARKNISTNAKQVELNCEKDSNRSDDRVREGSSSSSLESNSFNKKRCMDALCRMIIMDKLPFRVVECGAFGHFFFLLQPNFKMPSRETVIRECFQLYLEEMKKLKRMLVEKEQRVCLTAETWMSKQGLDYMVLTAHFIDDDWKLQKKILNFRLVPNRKGDTIGKTIEKCLLDWGIEKVFTVMVDNASYNDGDLAYLTEIIRNKNGVVLNGDLAPILNLMACDALKELHGTTTKIRSAIELVQSSYAIFDSFQNFVLDEKISCNEFLRLDVPTRWDSTYIMLDIALKFQKAFERLEAEDEEFCLKFTENEAIKVPPLSEDWVNARAFLNLLKLFHGVTLKVSGLSSCVTSHHFFHQILYIKQEIKEYSKSESQI